MIENLIIAKLEARIIKNYHISRFIQKIKFTNLTRIRGLDEVVMLYRPNTVYCRIGLLLNKLNK
jgi:hypothetical protein